MELGNVILWAVGPVLLVSFIYYLRGDSSEAASRVGGRWYAVLTGLLTVATAYLLYLFLTDRFQYSYVSGYSARDLELFYKISALWAGQEGTFLLWSWMAAILGLFVIRRGGPLMPRTMAYLLVSELFLLSLMYARSPFALLPSTNIPFDGRGLNPLLKDPWMVIHPPIVFLGYAVFTVPFCYALAALDKRAWQRFAAVAFPWTAWAIVTLGAGIFIGGFWAYKVLGWGGYWGWDPVENASLIPWLTGLALLHGLIIMKGTGKLVRTTIGLAIASYVLVVYGTFLTRSGVLADFSVHSFTDLGINVYLIGFLALVTVYSILQLLQRTRGIDPPPIATAITSREFGIVLGIVLLSLTAVLVWLGTSSPIFTTAAGKPANVSQAYYNIITLPLGIFIALVLGFSPFLLFDSMPWRDLFRAVLPGLIIAVAVTTAAWIRASLIWPHALLIFAAVLAIVSNLTAMIRFSHGQLMRIAGHLTHFGFGIMVLGIIASSGYASSEQLQLTEGEPVTAYGYDITFLGRVEEENIEKSYLEMRLTSGDENIMARPRLYTSPYNGQEMRSPFVMRRPLYDLYLSPVEYHRPEPENVIYMTKGETIAYGDWSLRFERFDVGSHAQTGAMRVGAVITAVRGDDSVTFMPILESQGGTREPIPTVLPGTDLTFALRAMSVEQRLIEISINDPAATADEKPGEILIAEVSIKPLIGFVWIGTIIIIVGSCLSYWRRRKEATLLD